jgi:uracil phosphoribosyltransferase
MALHILNRPFVQHTLTILRSKKTDQITFRKGMVRLGRILGYEIADIFDSSDILVDTPVAKAKGLVINDIDNIVIINVMRAATPLVEGLLKAFPNARQGVVVAKRDEADNLKSPDAMTVNVYYSKIPELNKKDTLIIADPMLATAATMLKVLDLVNGQPKRVCIAAAIASKYGIKRVSDKRPDIEIFTAAVDDTLNEKGYIVPGLGDAGDRAFG